jgi:hypothetical protein
VCRTCAAAGCVSQVLCRHEPAEGAGRASHRGGGAQPSAAEPAAREAPTAQAAIDTTSTQHIPPPPPHNAYADCDVTHTQSGKKMRCAQIVQPNEPLHVSEVDLPSVRGHQVLVKVAAAGVCHTGKTPTSVSFSSCQRHGSLITPPPCTPPDVHLWDDGYDLGGDKGLWRFSARGLPFPLTPGHEISGQ